MREIRFRAIIPERNATIFFDLDDIARPDRKFTTREILVPWLLKGNIPDLYIGIKDTINKKEMYGGDIVKIYTFISEEEPELNDFTIHKIEYKIAEDFPGFDLEPFLDCECNGLSWAMCAVECEGIEVIGNVTENPELLENIKKEEKQCQ